MKKRILIAVVSVLAVLFLNGCYYVFFGQERSMEKLNSGRRLSLYECCSVYSMNVAAVLFSWVLSPEAAEQCLLMQFAREGSFHTRKSDFWDSEFIQKQMLQHKGETFIVNYPLNDITGNKDSDMRNELRYALAYDGAVCTFVDGYPRLELEVRYDAYTAKYKVGPFDVNFHWQLLRHIQDRGWLHKCHITYLPK